MSFEAAWLPWLQSSMPESRSMSAKVKGHAKCEPGSQPNLRTWPSCQPTVQGQDVSCCFPFGDLKWQTVDAMYMRKLGPSTCPFGVQSVWAKSL